MSKKNNRRVEPVETVKPKAVSKQPSNNNAQKKETESTTLTITKTASLGITAVVTLAIIALSAFYLISRNSDVLFMAQTKEFFTTDRTFLEDCMSQPGGFISWIASFFIQFFYHPTLGASIMIAFWIASMLLSKFAFKVKSAWMAVLAIPVVCLLVSMIDTGYWIYYLKQTGYWFYGTIGYFLSMLMMFMYSFIKKRTDRIIATVLVAVTYPFCGWYTLLTLAYICVVSLTKLKHEKSLGDKIVLPTLPAVLIGIVPLIAYHLYAEIRIEDCWLMGFPRFTNDQLESFGREVPFIVLAAVPLLFPFLPKGKAIQGASAWMAYILTALILIGCYLWVDKNDFQNYNYHAEMRMHQAAEEQDWDKVLEEMSEIPGNASREMVLLKNIALLNKGEMGSKMFKYNNMGEPPTNGFDTLNVHMVQTAAPLIYYYHGKTNFSVRWCIENSVEYGFDFENLKMLARCSLVAGEMDAAKKYLTILKTSLYYKDWAERLMPITENPSLIKDYHEFDNVRTLYNHMGTVLDGDNGLCEMYLLNYFSNTMNSECKLLQELTLNYAMVQKDIQLFWPRFFLYAKLHPNQDMPIHYQEAAYLYGMLEPQTVNISGMPFDPSIPTRYQSFQQVSQSLLQSGLQTKDVGESMKSSFGDTFWWFYFFSRGLHSY